MPGYRRKVLSRVDGWSHKIKLQTISPQHFEKGCLYSPHSQKKKKEERKTIFLYKIISEECPRSHCIFHFHTKFNKNTHLLFSLKSYSTKRSCCSIQDLVESMPCPNLGSKHIQKANMGNVTGSGPRGPIHHCLHLHFLSLCCHTFANV